MAEITIPTIQAASASFGLVRADNALELLNGSEVYTVFQKAAWVLSFPLVIQTEQQARAWSAALASLSSFANHFKASPPGYTATIYSGTIPQVDGGSQLGTSLDIKNCTNSTTVFRAGEYFEVNGELKIVTANAVSNGSGLATVNFEPALRASPTNSSSLVITNPKTKFRLADSSAAWNIQPGRFYSITIDAVEQI
jgi:hypothetical protein